MNKAVPVITIDGPGGAGKGTVSLRIAQKLGYHFLDSGALYRVLVIAAKHHGVSLDEEPALNVLAAHLDVEFKQLPETLAHRIILEGEDVTDIVREEDTGFLASKISAFPEVRAALLERQRAFRSAPGLVADGRDMGTVVFPDAQVKVFLTASAEERAKRRHKQLKEQGINVSIGHLLEQIVARDERDQSRAVAPLKPANDAIVIDTTELSIEKVVEIVEEAIEQSH